MREVIRNTGKKKKRKNGLKIIAVAVLVLFAVITYSSVELQAEKRALEKQKAELEEQLQTEQERSEELEDKKAYMQTVRYIEEVARKVLGLVYPDETILRPEEEE
ncbi:MAG: septum formation initiator family protein [Lachnospiraceae bacterium]|nr:septum formation initiator family protein [Lachnospiraceae bacterium]